MISVSTSRALPSKFVAVAYFPSKPADGNFISIPIKYKFPEK